MPAINPGSGPSGTRKPRPKPKPAPRVVRNADTGDRARSRPAPKIQPTGVFKGAPKPATAPITQARTQATQRTAKARAKLPAPAIAAPPVIRNPTPKQTQAAKQQIVQTIRTAVGPAGTGKDRQRRQAQLLREIRTQPRYRNVKASLEHWTREERKITAPQDPRKVAKPGPKPKKVGIGPASINLSATAGMIGTTVAAATPGLQGKTPERQFVKNALNDIAHLPLMAPQTAYEISRATIDLAQGDTKRAKEILHGLTEGVIGNLVTGDFDGALQYAREHPVFAALEVRGGKGVTGRGAGAVMRSGAVGEKAKRAASTRRADINLSGEGAKVADRQHYSADVFTKALQVAVEKARGGEGKTVARDHRLRRRADFESDTAAATSRAVRGDEATAAQRDAPRRGRVAGTPRNRVVAGVTRPVRAAQDAAARFRGREEAAIVGLVTQGVVRAGRIEEDLRKELDRLDTAYGSAKFSTGAQERQNRVNAVAIRDILSNPAALENLDRVAASARANTRAINDLQGRAIDLGALHPDRAERAKLFPAAQAHMGAKFESGGGGEETLRVEGRKVANDEIKAILDGQEVAYLPHHTRNRGARAYYQTAFAGRKNVDSSKKRTGAAFEKGTVDSSYKALTEHRIRMRGVVSRIAEHDRIIGDIAIKGPDGQMMTWDQAEKMASNAADRGAKLVPYRAVPGSYDKARIEAIANDQRAAAMPSLDELVGHEFAERLKAPSARDATARNVVLVPEQIVNQLKEQQKISGVAGKAGNVAADVFRRTVLPFSTKWLMGNIVEAGARLGAVGAGPNAWRIGRNLLKEMDKLDRDQAIRVRAALTGGLLYGNRGLTVRRLSEQFEGTALAKPAAGLSVAGQLPVVKQLGQVMKGFTDGVFAFNRAIESNAQVAALGKWAKREMQEMGASWYKANVALGKALEDVANGQMDTKNVHDAARYIDQTLGQYSRFSPPMRRIVQSATPFLPWYVNAARYVAWTLPAKHPIKTGLYTLVAQNLQDDFDASHGSLPPGDLRGEIVEDDGTILPFGRYLPTSLFTGAVGGGNEQLTTLVDPFFPQFKSAALAAFGLNFSGHQAKIPPQDRGTTPGTPGAVRATMAFNSLLEAFVPAVGIGKRIREGGSTGYDNSTIFNPKIKPGTKVPGGAANRILNPVRPVSGIKGTPRTIEAPPAPEVSDDPLDVLDDALDDAALDEIDAALDIIP